MPDRSSRLSAVTGPDASPPDRRRCGLEFADEFWASAEKLAGLGANETLRRARAGSAVREFFTAWIRRTGASDHELSQGRWRFKTLQGKRAKTAKLRQIALTNEQGGIRVALIVEEGERCVMSALLTYHKRHQSAEIERAAVLALERRREQP